MVDPPLLFLWRSFLSFFPMGKKGGSLYCVKSWDPMEVTTPYGVVYDGVKPMCFDFDRWGRKARCYPTNSDAYGMCIMKVDVPYLLNIRSLQLAYVCFSWRAIDKMMAVDGSTLRKGPTNQFMVRWSRELTSFSVSSRYHNAWLSTKFLIAQVTSTYVRIQRTCGHVHLC